MTQPDHSKNSEFNRANYIRIYIINMLLSFPMLMLFAWPYMQLSNLLGISESLGQIGGALFAIPFSITVLHGHVSMALGTLQRHYYYDWLHSHRFTYGLLFHPVIVRTRFRLTLIGLSMLVFLLGLVA